MVLIAFTLLGIAVPAWAAPGFSMNARAAYEGRVKPGGWVTVLVDLTNDGREITGELVAYATAGDGWQRFPHYVTPLTLPAGGKKRIPVSVPLSGVGQVLVRFVSDGATVQEQKVDLTMVPPSAQMIGVLSDDELGIPALARLREANSRIQTEVVRMDAATFPARAALLEDFDVIALSRFDTSTLSQEQLRALEAWVGRGGILMIAGGPEHRRTLAPLPPSLVPVNITGVREAAIAALGALVDESLAGKAPVSDGRALRGQILAKEGDTPLVVQDVVGSGKVLYLAVDPGLDPVAGWAGQPKLLQRTLGLAPSFNNHWWGYTENMMYQALKRMPGLALPSLLLISGLLVLYLVLVGPANYIILKRMDRREWAWATVPLISILFVGTVYGVGFSRRSSMFSHVITVTELSPGTGAGVSTAYVGLYAPSRTSVSVDLENAKLVHPFTFGGGPGTDVLTRVIAGEKTTLELLGMNNYSLRSFSVEQDISVKGGLELTQVSMGENGLKGRVVNKLDQPLSDVTVRLGGIAKNVGALEPGATSGEFELPLSVTGLNPKEMEMLRMQGRMPGNEQFQVDAQRRQAVADAMFNHPDGSNRMGRSIVVSGWAAQPLVAPTLPDLGRMDQDANMIYAVLPMPSNVEGGEIPPGMVTAALIEAPDNHHMTERGTIQMGPGSYTYSLVLPVVDRSNIASMSLHLWAPNDAWFERLSMEARNVKSGEWVKLKPAAVQELPNWQELFSDGGAMELRVEVGSDMHMELSVPTISTKGVSR